ncbi:transglycosylase SLT domain-containing protein [Myxacorys almedinensis A]|uniref:Transglycosylase SLT domain-containing protein n=1 Tax=Myxacorys almedinensis A TaxID=2690445 RepID=A0A8J7Z3A6_9CYAN|nr:transglycosylase SLT domain-containing protein [Myxacorys almedinensis A]
MMKERKVWISLAVGAGALALVSGVVLPIEKLLKQDAQPSADLGAPETVSSKPNTIGAPGKVVSPLVAQSAQQRAGTLEAVVNKRDASLERNRARYMLASDLVAQGQGEKALEPLKNLENDYPVLAPQILLKRAQAYQAAGRQKDAIAAWQEIVKQHQGDPAAAEALFLLGKNNPNYWDQALTQFPAHPRSLEIAKLRFQKNQKQLPVLLTLAKYGVDTKGYTQILDKLTSEFASQLKPADWDAIAFGYWENLVYDKAAIAYSRAPQTPQNVYRSGRGLHLTGTAGSEARYQQVVRQFPKSEEAGLALMRLASLADTPQSAIAYYDQVAQHFPSRAAEALLEKSKKLDTLNSAKTAAMMRQLVLSQYADSNAAAEMRWTYAQDRAKAGDLKLAREWAAPILKSRSKSDIAAQAGFWVGKWSQRLGQDEVAKEAYEQVLKQHPESYYAWRSAGMLGWNVGDFSTVRSLNPPVRKPAARPELLAGSDAMKELYQMGQDRDAWAYWQVEFRDRTNPTVAEQFTDGIMRLGIGDNLDGIYMVSSLRDRETPEDQEHYQHLVQQPAYWQALYPFPFVEEIESWSQQRQLNPMLVTALIRQESRFEPNIRSSVGAAGLMQVMPETASFIATNIKLKEYKLDDPQDNINLGTWYLDHTHQEYANNSMLAIASYNAGPGAVGGWVSKAKTQDADEFVEQIPYQETRGYVKSVLGNYWNYMRLYNPELSQRLSQLS